LLAWIDPSPVRFPLRAGFFLRRSESNGHRQRQLDRPAGIVGLQKVEKEVWHRSALLGAALAQLVGHIVGDVARPSFVGVECDYPNGIVALSF
jgi:hypothetical protein